MRQTELRRSVSVIRALVKAGEHRWGSDPPQLAPGIRGMEVENLPRSGYQYMEYMSEVHGPLDLHLIPLYCECASLKVASMGRGEENFDCLSKQT